MYLGRSHEYANLIRELRIARVLISRFTISLRTVPDRSLVPLSEKPGNLHIQICESFAEYLVLIVRTRPGF